MTAKYHKLTIMKSPDGKVEVTVDVLRPVAYPLAGMPIKDQLMLLFWPYSRDERAMMKAVKGLPVIARRAIAADILAARRETLLERRRQQAIEMLISANASPAVKNQELAAGWARSIPGVSGLITQLSPYDVAGDRL